MFQETGPRPHAPFRRAFTLTLVLVLAAAAIIGVPASRRAATASTAEQSGPPLRIHSPAADAVEDEASALLGWTARSKGDVVVFLSRKSLAGRSARDLIADPAVIKKVTSASSLPLRDIVRGEPGTSTWSWAVALRHDDGTYEMSAPSSFRSVKTFEARSANPLLISESRRGSVTPVSAGVASLTLDFANGYRFDPLRDGVPAVPAELAARTPKAGETAGYLVQFKGPVLPGERSALVAAGALPVAWVPGYAYLVRMTPEARAEVEALPSVRWVGAYLPAFKLSGDPRMQGANGSVTVTVLLFPDADLILARSGMEALGAAIEEATDSGRAKVMRMTVAPSRLADIAVRGDVAWVEPFFALHTTNSVLQWVVQTNVSNSRRVWDMGIRGEGQVVHTSDSGIRTSHNSFRDAAVPITTFGQYPTHRKIIAYEPAVLGGGVVFGDAAGASYHGTHTTGTIVGDDSPFAADTRDGNALKGKIWFHDGGALTNSIIAPGDLNLMFQAPYTGNAGGAARISSNSWGGDAMGAYTVHSMTADQFMWDHKDFLVNFSNGNAGPEPASVGSPATMKNGISSGACENGTLAGTPAYFSSQGPAADLRLKPTMMTPGSGIVSANGAGDTGYKSLSGTSMSCPAGAAGEMLIRQYCMEGWYPTGVKTPANAFTPSGALLKAMAISSTDNDMTGLPIPNNVVGWGRMKVDNILYFPGDAARTALVDQTDGLLTGDFIEYEVRVDGAAVPLKITLCWFDKEGSPAAARQLVNDLNLTVTDPLNVTYTGNVFAGGQSVPGGAGDTLNVEECVRLNTPQAGVYRIRVSAANIPFGPQPFALAISGQLGGTSGFVQLDRLRYGADDLIEIRVEDLNATGPLSVAVSSATESTPETVSLAGGNGVFTGSIATTALAPALEGKLSVSHGDAITVTYDDASPVISVSVMAEADFTGPVITNVGGTGTDQTRTVTWITDVPASSRVYYGTTPSLGLASAEVADLVTGHALTLTGLAPETTYYFDVESRDQAGNTTRDDAGGFHYRFTTSAAGDILLAIGDSSFPHEAYYQSAFRNYGWNGSVLAGSPTDNPPVGDRNSGLRSYTAVLWQSGYEQYPAVTDAARDSIQAYLDGGGRFSISTHDMAWSFTDGTSGYSTAARIAWMNNYMHVSYVEDPPTWSANRGVVGDPISGDYATGILYTPQRTGGAGDEVNVVNGTGTGTAIWTDTDATIGNIAVRWQNLVPNGSPANAVWGGTPSKVVTNCYEWAQINDPAAREDILDKTLIWLIGHDHPDAAVTAPNGGEELTGSSVSVSWTETAYGGTSVAARSLSYSPDGGASWIPITAAPGASPYVWDISALPNGPNYRVRIQVTDDASPALRGGDTSDASFAINRPGGDTRGPVVVAGSIASNPNPMDNAFDATLSATLTDVAFGNSNIAAAEWSVGEAASPAGSGQPMAGSFSSPVVNVSATVPAFTVSKGARTFWVRGRDAGGAWGPATAQEFVVNGQDISGAGEGRIPALFALEQNAPNPFNPTTTIRFHLPAAGPVELSIFTVQGRKIRSLISGHRDAGPGSVVWDGTGDSGVPVTSGIYFYRLSTPDRITTRKMVMAK